LPHVDSCASAGASSLFQTLREICRELRDVP
jgi:hypothetical protein